MYLLGHADPKLMMGVYQQVLDLGSDGIQGLEDALGCDVEEAFAAFSGRGVLAANWQSTRLDAPQAAQSSLDEKPQSQS